MPIHLRLLHLLLQSIEEVSPKTTRTSRRNTLRKKDEIAKKKKKGISREESDDEEQVSAMDHLFSNKILLILPPFLFRFIFVSYQILKPLHLRYE